MAQHYSNLTHVRVCGCVHVTDAALVSLAQYAYQLACFGLSSCPLISDEGLIEAVSLSGARLEELELADNRISDKATVHVFATCSRLRRLDVSNCVGITDASCEALGVCECAAAGALEVLLLRGCRITSKGIDVLVCPCLKKLREIELDLDKCWEGGSRATAGGGGETRLGEWQLSKENHIAGASRLLRPLNP